MKSGVGRQDSERQIVQLLIVHACVYVCVCVCVKWSN